MNILIFTASVYLAFRMGDRLRQINWHSTRPQYVCMYLCGMLWCLSVMYTSWGDLVTDQTRWLAAWFRSTGMATIFCLLEITKRSWASGVPDAAKTAPGELRGSVR